ncbi:MAG: hypothetical protein HOW73_23610 [Polyangiaceae bacterium]|nr:hypothetical protein [Polyangiaceae bacterium]
MTLRPRLAEHALLRRHVVDGKDVVVIHHALTGALVTLDERAATFVGCADGTRDLDGITLAVARAGMFERQSEIEAVFAALDEHGLLAEGIEPGPVMLRSAEQWMTPAEPVRADVPIEALSGYRFRCDGVGACCSQYATIALSNEDLRRARHVGMRTLPGDEDARRVVLPLYGGVRTERVAMTLVDGRCLQLDDDRRCGLHVRGGEAAKPTACRMYPATIADIGTALRASVAVECDCTISSLNVAPEEGAPIVPETMRHAGDLPLGIAVRVVADPVALMSASPNAPSRFGPRAEVVAWIDRVLDEGFGDDAINACVVLARALESGDALVSVPTFAPIGADELAGELEGAVAAIARDMTGAAQAADAWRSERDRTRRLRRAIASAASAVLDRGLADTLLAPDAAMLRAELFALRAALFGMHVLTAGRPAAAALRELAGRFVVARELAIVGSKELGHPLAAVMASIRGA